MLSVETTATSVGLSVEPTTTLAAVSGGTSSELAGQPATLAIATTTVLSNPSTSMSQASQTPGENGRLQLQVQATTSVERTTLIVPPTFPISALSSSNPGLMSATPSLTMTTGMPPSSQSAVYPTTWTLPVHTIARTPSASASSSPIVQPPMSHPHISPALIILMVFGGTLSLGLSLYVFKRVRHKATHVSRSQFQMTGPSAVAGSSSEQSFVSGGLGRGQLTKREKNGDLNTGAETPLWGGTEKFSPQIGTSVVDYPPAAQLGEGSRAPMRHRQSVFQTIRRYSPGNRLSRPGPGWNMIPERQDLRTIPTVKITDMDTRHNRLGSNSTLSSALEGSPDPNLATIQVASVTRSLSAAASYRIGSPSPPPSLIPGLDHPRPAPKVPAKALVLDRAPPMPRIPVVTITSSERVPNIPGKKPLDSRGKIAITDISKPQPVVPVNPEFPGGNSCAAAAAAGVGSPIPGEDHTFRGFDKKVQQATEAPKLGVTPIARSLLPPASPGLGEVGNIMLRPFGEAGSMIPVFLETPAIGPDGRSSYLSTNLGLGSGSTTGSLRAITVKGASATLETEQSAGTLSPSMLSDHPSRRTIASAYSQDWIPLSQQAHLLQNPDYKSPTYSIYNYYGPDRASVTPRVPSMVYGEHEEHQIGGAL
ncbi:hypothetical protein FRC06_007420 [Ceratobasidium sp. 370]|nr:hypothetical protein FRC06_007420 [Ceratobasidium sp. 370]